MIKRSETEIQVTRDALDAMIPFTQQFNAAGEDQRLGLKAQLAMLDCAPDHYEVQRAFTSPYMRACAMKAIRWLEGTEENSLIDEAIALLGDRRFRPVFAWENPYRLDPFTIIELKRAKSLRKFGVQNHEDGIQTTVTNRIDCDRQRKLVDRMAADGKSNWAEILREEYLELICAESPDELIGELADVACVATFWIEAIQRRQTKALERVEVETAAGADFPTPPAIAKPFEKISVS